MRTAAGQLLWTVAIAAALVCVVLPGGADAQDIPHEELSFSCTACHRDPDDRSQIEFDHGETGFPLDGGHVKVECARCHELADFARTDDQCAACHTDVHQARLYPDCEACHSPAGWTVIDHDRAHSRTAFQLIGAHVRLDCDACHPREIVAERAQLWWDCVDCHQADYDATLDPSHAQAGFGTRCETCHLQLAWHPTTLRNHPGDFPIFSGTHAGVWGSCSDCHINPADYHDFSCLNCHEHSEALMDEEHDDVPYYYYDSNGCYGCHPTGEEP